VRTTFEVSYHLTHTHTRRSETESEKYRNNMCDLSKMRTQPNEYTREREATYRHTHIGPKRTCCLCTDSCALFTHCPEESGTYEHTSVNAPCSATRSPLRSEHCPVCHTVTVYTVQVCNTTRACEHMHLQALLYNCGGPYVMNKHATMLVPSYWYRHRYKFPYDCYHKCH
jgi:hypothetical protein